MLVLCGAGTLLLHFVEELDICGGAYILDMADAGGVKVPVLLATAGGFGCSCCCLCCCGVVAGDSGCGVGAEFRLG